MKTKLIVVACLALITGCQEMNYITSEVGIGDACSPSGGTFLFTFEEIPGEGISCGSRKDEAHKYGRSNIPSGLEVSDDLCDLSGVISGEGETSDINLHFDTDWNVGHGTIRVLKSTCDSTYNVTVTRK